MVYTFDYKPPYKFTTAEILHGLRGEILPARDLINKKGRDFELNSKRLVSAVVTELFSTMVRSGVQYGYVSTGQVTIFLHISDDPGRIEYHVCNPRDCDLNEPTSVLKTALAEVIALTIQALRDKPLPQKWFDAAAKLGTCGVW